MSSSRTCDCCDIPVKQVQLVGVNINDYHGDYYRLKEDLYRLKNNRHDIVERYDKKRKKTLLVAIDDNQRLVRHLEACYWVLKRLREHRYITELFRQAIDFEEEEQCDYQS